MEKIIIYTKVTMSFTKQVDIKTLYTADTLAIQLLQNKNKHKHHKIVNELNA